MSGKSKSTFAALAVSAVPTLLATPAIAQSWLDFQLRQNIDIRQETEINVSPPSVNVDVHMPKPKEGIFGRGKWIEIATLNMGEYQQCRESPWWCSFIAAVELGSIERKGSKVSAETALLPIQHSSRKEKRRVTESVIFQAFLGDCDKKTFWNKYENKFVPVNRNMKPILEFACES